MSARAATGLDTWLEANRRWWEVMARLPTFAPRSSPDLPKNASPRSARYPTRAAAAISRSAAA